MFHVSPGKYSGTDTAIVGKNSKGKCCICSEIGQSCLSSFGMFKSMACKLMFYHNRQLAVSEAKESHSLALLICLEVCRLAQNDITHYQTQPLTCVVCLGLIFLSSTFKNWSCSSGPGSRHSLDEKAPSAPAWRTISMFLVLPSCRTPFTSSVCQPFLYVRLLSIHVSLR